MAENNKTPKPGKVKSFITDVVTKYGKKKVMTTIFLILVAVGSTIGYMYTQNQTVVNETIVTPSSKASDYVNGMKNWTVNQNVERHFKNIV